MENLRTMPQSPEAVRMRLDGTAEVAERLHAQERRAAAAGAFAVAAGNRMMNDGKLFRGAMLIAASAILAPKAAAHAREHAEQFDAVVARYEQEDFANQYRESLNPHDSLM